MENKLVSVVIPTYGRPKYLSRAIKSVLNQDYSNIEIIIVDDNNPNTQERIETEKTMEEFSTNEKVIYLQHECNKNGSAARNTGWRASKGEYIAFLDDDDEFLPQKISSQLKTMEELDCSWGACYSGYYITRANGKIEQSAEKRSGNLYIQALMRTLYIMGGSNLFVRRKVVEEINGFDEGFRRNQDIEFLVRILEKYKLAHVETNGLHIHLEIRDVKRTFEEVDAISLNYINTFSERINNLEKNDKKKVMSVISLERARIALQYKKYKIAIKILKQNHVPFRFIVKYMIYVIRRIFNKKSFGFSL